MPYIASTVFDLVDRIAAAVSPAEVWGAYMTAARAAGFEFGAVFLANGDEEMDRRCYTASLPEGWLLEYGARHCAAIDPCLPPTRESATAFEIRVGEWHGDPLRRPWHDLDRDAGIEHILIIPFRADGIVRAVALCGREFASDPHDRMALQFAGVETILRLRTLRAGTTGSTAPALSDRERECLQWIAAGKSDWEIATILNLSERTVNVYVERAKHKMKAATRTQAIVLALRQGAIRP